MKRVLKNLFVQPNRFFKNRYIQYTNFLKDLYDVQFFPRFQTVEEMLEKTSRNSSTQKKLIKRLRLKNNPNATPENFERFFIELGAGIKYVSNKYGTTPEKICLTRFPDKDIRSFLRPNPYRKRWQSHTIASYESYDRSVNVNWRAVGAVVNEYDEEKEIPSGYWTSQHFEKGRPRPETQTEYTIKIGLEEAYHHYQFTSQRKKYSDQVNTVRIFFEEGEEAYSKTPIEVDAKKFCSEVISNDFGLRKNSSRINPELNSSQEYSDISPQQWHVLRALKQTER